MYSRKIKRIYNEIKELKNSVDLFKESGIYFHINDEDLENIMILIIGPENTPYHNGFYFFKLNYPDNYPMVPPVMKYCTQGILNSPKDKPVKIRFNPNLYTNGKVCLSMLNTWRGPGWVPTNTISNILVALQALVLNDKPLMNEPGFENAKESDIEMYNTIIGISNIKISVCDQLKQENLNEFECFREIMINYFKENIDKYDTFINKFEEFKESELNSYAYGLHVKFNFDDFKNYYDTIKVKLNI